MSALTLVGTAIIVYGLVSRHGYGIALALSGSTAAGAFIVVGSEALSTFYTAALLVPILLLRVFPVKEECKLDLVVPPGLLPLALFFVWSCVVTLAAPLIFNGQAVIIVSNGAPSLIAGVLTGSNIAQIAYLGLGVCIVWFLGVSPKSRPILLGLVLTAATLLSFWRYLGINLGLPFPFGFFDNSPSFGYVEAAPGGIERFRGINSEPASLAVTVLATMAYMIPVAIVARGLRRLGALFVLSIAGFLGVVSTSATFYVAGVATGAILFTFYTLSLLRNRIRTGPFAVTVGLAFTVSLVLVVPIVSRFIGTIVNAKVASTSYSARSTADSGSFGVLLDTFGVGVGLGSARASSFFPTLLAATGVLGAILFVTAVGTLLIKGGSTPTYRPVVWVMVAVLVVKATSSPDLSDTSGILWITLGLLARAATSRVQSNLGGLWDSSSRESAIKKATPETWIETDSVGLK